MRNARYGRNGSCKREAGDFSAGIDEEKRAIISLEEAERASNLTEIATESYTSGDFEYYYNYYDYSGSKYITISGYKGSATNLTIPSTINGHKVTAIGSAFFGCETLKSVTIPDSVTSIGWGAFYDCSNLTSVTIPDSVTTIGGCAFAWCTKLTSITIPKSVKTIDGDAFLWSENLKTIKVNSDNTYYKSKDGILFNKDLTTLVIFPAGKSGSYTIPNSVTSIGDYAFYSCDNLTGVTIPESVTSIGSTAFSNSGITSITIPKSVTSIGSYALYSCYSLKSITVDGDNANYKSRNGVLFNKDLTSLITYPAGKTDVSNYVMTDSVKTIESQAFFGSKLKSITISKNVTSVGNRAFMFCSKLTSIKVDSNNANFKSKDGVLFNKDLSELIAFPYGISGSYVIPSSVTSIGALAFYYCYNLTSITIPNSVTSIGASAFYYCENLTSITIPNSVTSIGDMAFFGCNGLTSIKIPSSVTTIGSDAFGYCEKLSNVTLSNAMGSYMFIGCHNLKSITIPEGITSISWGAFSYCNNLKSVTIPNSVTSIDGYSFSECTSLTNITIPNSVTTIGGYAFNGCTNLKSITIPSSVTTIKYGAFEDCTNLASVTIPSSVTSIDSDSFSGCDNLTIYGATGSYAETFANLYSIPFLDLNNIKFTSTVTATAGNRSVTLSWGKVGGATGYIVKSADGKTKYTNSTITSTKYTVSNLKNGTQYQFKVYAYVAGKWVGSSKVTKTPVAKPTSVTATANNKKVTLSWEKVPNATNYIVKSADGKIQYTNKSITATSYTVSGLTNGTKYKFKVYAKSDGKWFASSTISKTPTATPQNVTAVAGSKKITLSWNKVDGATSYVIKSADGKTQYTKSAIKTNSYTVTGLTGGTQYKFKVYAKVDGKWYASSTVTRTAKN